MKIMKRAVSFAVAFSILLCSFGICSTAASEDKPVFEDLRIISSKSEYSAGESVEISVNYRNQSMSSLTGVVTYVQYNGDVCLGPGVTEIDVSSIMPGGSFSGGFTLTDSSGAGSPVLTLLIRAIMKIYMFISRTVVIVRQTFASGRIFARRSKECLGTCSVIYNGKEVNISVNISYCTDDDVVYGNTDITFAPISSEDVKVSGEEKALCRSWFEKNVVNAGADGTVPAYSFEIGGVGLSDMLSDWSFAITKKDVPYEKYRNGQYSEIALSSEKYGVSGRVEAVIYENSATCEWTVYLENTAGRNSKKISNFNALDTFLETGKSSIYASKGSSSASDDFTLFELTGNDTYSFDCREGRSSDRYMPYFNICGKEFSACLGIGWSGMWKADLEKTDTGVGITAKQETLNAALLPGEEIRSPLVSLTFYKNGNAVKGFNIFRDWVLNSLLPEDLPEKMLNTDAFFVSPTRTAEEMLGALEAIPDESFEYIDNLWIDAGWYCAGSDSIWDDRFGVWETVPERFPDGMQAVSDYAESRNAGVVLWYEEERLSNISESALYSEGKKHDDWILGKDGKSYTTGLVWNFGNEDALQYIRQFIGASVKANGVTVYREDSNFDPLSYWQYGDKHFNGGRSGITENHYVEGHYRFLDYLFEDNEKLRFYDCCASGGRRLDLEVIRRGVPLWRSDYNCDQTYPDILEATQSQTYSASFWLPYTGTYYSVGNDYRARTALFQGYQVYCGDMANPAVYPEIVKYDPERALMNKNFYPISFGGTKLDSITAMQYGDEEKGFAVIYKRQNVAEDSLNFSLSGLAPGAMYSVYDYDSPENVSVYSGAELMNNALTVPFATGSQAIIIEYLLSK